MSEAVRGGRESVLLGSPFVLDLPEREWGHWYHGKSARLHLYHNTQALLKVMKKRPKTTMTHFKNVVFWHTFQCGVKTYEITRAYPRMTDILNRQSDVSICPRCRDKALQMYLERGTLGQYIEKYGGSEQRKWQLRLRLKEK